MSNFAELAKMRGEEVESLGPIKNEGYKRHVFKPGFYQGLVSTFSITYKDREGKKCEKDTPGATPAFAGLRLIIVKDTDGVLIDNNLNFDKNVKDIYSKMNYFVYLSLDPKQQWVNVKLLKDFTTNNIPEASVIQGKDGEEDIYMSNITLYYGCPVSWDIIEGKKEDVRYIQNLTLIDHQTLTPDLIKQRKAVVDSINAKMDIFLKELKAQREKEKKDKAAESPASDADTILDGIPTPNGAQSPNDVDGGSEFGLAGMYR